MGSRKRPMKQPTAVLSILVAHDDEIIRIGLCTLLNRQPRSRVCGQSSSAVETLKKVEKLQPTILLLKLDLPDKTGLEIIPELLKLRPGLKILLFAAEAPSPDVIRSRYTPSVTQVALEQGALGMMLNPDAEDLRLAVDALSKNKAFISPSIFEGISNELTQRIEQIPIPSIGELTKRELEVFKQMAIGRTSKEIASDLGTSPRTVEVQRAKIMHKLGFQSQADLILFAVQHGVVELPKIPQ